ncbi:unnamed protein product [marine sediment metagenome]|uniref:Uncharacterized protein n=1 Tax=marine sediment metagenome TaxID=412755 RepID=X0T161_9ZZZZ
MAQLYNTNVYQRNHIMTTDMQNMENNFACLKSNFSGSSAAANVVQGMRWYDTTNKAMKYYNAGWYKFFQGDVNQKMLVYRNSAMDGWVIVADSSSDRVAAIKGGLTYTTGGSTAAGTWQQPNHTLTINEYPAHTHGERTYNDDNAVRRHTAGAYSGYLIESFYWNPDGYIYTDYDGGAGGAHNHGGDTWRPAAAVFTIQRLDV